MSWGVALRNAVGLGLGGIPSLRKSGLYPKISFDFTGGVLDPLITFTRASSATYFDSAGVLKTAANDVARFDYNPSTLAALGLLIEEQRTNLCLYSEDLNNAAWVKAVNVTTTYNTTVAPDGATTADTLTVSNAGSNNGVYQSITVSASTSYVWSWWVKLGTLAVSDFKFALYNNTAGAFIAQDIVPTQTPSSSAWTRISYAFTTPVGCTSIRVYVFRNFANIAGTLNVWGMQLEQGSFQTSYIATTTASATRSADVATISGTNFTKWFQSGPGTIYAVYDSSNTAQNNNVLSISDGTTSNRITLRATNSSGQSAFAGVNGGATQWAITAAGATTNTSTKAAGAYDTDNISYVRDGGAVGTDSSASIPTVNQLKIGTEGDGTLPLNGHVKAIKYYSIRLQDRDLQAITS